MLSSKHEISIKSALEDLYYYRDSEATAGHICPECLDNISSSQLKRRIPRASSTVKVLRNKK